jgi:cysteinyl-tRNA synthetase
MIMKATDTLSKIKNILGMELSKDEVKNVDVKAEEVTLATMNLENGTVIEAEEFTSGKEVFIVTEDDRVPMPVGEYTLEDGRSVVVEEEGVIASIAEAAEEPVAEEEEVEANKEETSEELTTEFATKEQFDELKAMVEELTVNLSEVLKSKEVELSEVKEELSATPDAEPLKHSPENNKENDDFYHIASQRTETRLDRIMRKLS